MVWVILQVSFVKQSGNAGLQQPFDIFIRDENACGIVRVTEDHQLCFRVDRSQHGVGVVLHVGCYIDTDWICSHI